MKQLILLCMITQLFALDALTLSMQSELQNIVNTKAEEYDLVGLSANVTLFDGTVWNGTYGISYDDVAITPQTHFGIGSITKVYMSCLTMTFVADGDLSLSDTIGSYITPPENIRGDVTIEQLLTHTSGIYNNTNHPEWWEKINENPVKHWTPEEILTLVKEPNKEPGVEYEYSNSNFIILGMILEKIGNKTVATLMDERLFTPLGYSQTALCPKYKEALSHYWWRDENYTFDVTETWATPSMFSHVWTAGGMSSTPEETSRFLMDMFCHKKILSRESIIEILRERQFEWSGLGIFRMINEQKKGMQYYYGHPGAQGHCSFTYFFPDDSMAITVATNLDCKLEDTGILDSMLTVLYSEDSITPSDLTITEKRDFFALSGKTIYRKVDATGVIMIHSPGGQEVSRLTPEQRSLSLASIPSGVYIVSMQEGSKRYHQRCLLR